MIMKSLINAAKKEAAKLRKHASPAEIAKLNFEDLSPRSPNYCIYGQMTGWCYSDRAGELLRACAVAWTDDYDRGSARTLPAGTDILKQNFRLLRYFSPIETLIVAAVDEDREDINQNLVAYLRGETDEFAF